MAFSGDSSVRRLTNKDDPRRAAKEYNQRERERIATELLRPRQPDRGEFFSHGQPDAVGCGFGLKPPLVGTAT